MVQVSVEGPRGGQVDHWLRGHIHLAVIDFAKQLSISRMKTNVKVKVHHSAFVDVEKTSTGCCEAIDSRNFILDIALYSNWLVALAHEMVHVKQFARGELDFGLTRWKTNRYCDNIKYWDQPWEKEARRLQFWLAEEFEKRVDSK